MTALRKREIQKEGLVIDGQLVSFPFYKINRKQLTMAAVDGLISTSSSSSWIEVAFATYNNKNKLHLTNSLTHQ